MPQLAIKHRPHPVFLYAVKPLFDDTPTIVPMQLIVTCDERTRIGEIKAAWQVAIRKPLAGRSIQKIFEWGPYNVLDTIFTPVSNGDLTLDAGEHVIDFAFSLPTTLPATAATDFELVSHTVVVSVQAPSPEYSANNETSTSSSKGKAKEGGSGISGWFWSSSQPPKPEKTSRTSVKPPEFPPPPKQFEQGIASASTSIQVVLPLFAEGKIPEIDITKKALVPNLGSVDLLFGTGFMTLGSLAYTCIQIRDIDPLATITECVMSLEQRSASTDEVEEHFHQWTLEKWTSEAFGPPIFTAMGRIVEPNSGNGGRAQQPREPSSGLSDSHADEPHPEVLAAPTHLKARDAPVPFREGIHLTGSPRFPSRGIGGRATTSLGHHDQVSSTTHAILLDIFYSVGGSLPEEESRNLQVRFRMDTTISDCTLARDTVQVPKYTSFAETKAVDVSECMEPYVPGSEPRPWGLPHQSWIKEDGKTISGRRHQLTPKQVRDHQVDTQGLCMCFYEESFQIQPEGANLLEYLEFWTASGDNPWDDRLQDERDRLTEVWRKRHPNHRKGFPGVLNIVIDDCSCTFEETPEEHDPNRPKAGVTLTTNT